MSEKKKRISAFSNDALGTLDGVGIAEKISSGEISATEAVEAAIARARLVGIRGTVYLIFELGIPFPEILLVSPTLV